MEKDTENEGQSLPPSLENTTTLRGNSSNKELSGLKEGEWHADPMSNSNHISLSEVDPVDIQVRNVKVNVDTSPYFFSPAAIWSNFTRRRNVNGESMSQTETVIYDISANMCSGTFTAIIGGSGSGKTSMLNTMAERMSNRRLSISGRVTFNGKTGISNVRSAYIMQQDVLQPTLTVRETLQYSANLRLPPPTTAEERKRVVEEVILELGLKDCADTRIGTSTHRGCSGGEKRRTSIGVQLLSNPSVLLLDEPTTGLDAASAYQLARTLKVLACKGRTIVATLHQPRSEIWHLLDNLVILAKGSPVYSGLAANCIPYFKERGMELPAFVNPAEFVIDCAAVDNRSPELEATSAAKVQHLKDEWQHQNDAEFGTEQGESETSDVRLNRFLPRQKSVTYRDSMGMVGLSIEAILMGILTGYIFFGLETTQAGIRSRQGALYTASSLQSYIILVFETYRFSIDIKIYDWERTEGVVGVVSFLLSRRLARFFVEDFIPPLLYSIIFCLMAGFRYDVTQFFIFFATVLLSHHTAIGFATTCVAIVKNFGGASVIANVWFTMQTMACGYFIQANTIPVYLRWIKWTAYGFYAFGALCANEFVGHFYDCPLPGGEGNPACAPYTGAYIMNSLGFPNNWTKRPIIALLGFVILFYGISGLILRFKPVSIGIGQARKSDTDFSAGKEKMIVRPMAELRTISIGLDNFALDLDKRVLFGKPPPTKTILHPITATFQAGLLNVIMGPSGSGKSSLLNAMALRLQSDVRTKYRHFGKMTFNGSVPSDSVVRSVCSYVCQDDDALLPSLTVRETLRFAAGLRLPPHMSKAQKNQKAENILLKMGLKDCADNLVGSDLIKGISGGEKRRVTIAVQILTDPRILLLDEPTSGLDSFTASSIMEVLQGLALEGRTIVFTIHQSRSDLFKHFGNILLLARGGSPCYVGKGGDMLPYFASLGFPCPTITNPADFALDLITVDLRHRTREEVSRSNIQSIITSWGSENLPSVNLTTIAAPAELASLKRHTVPFATTYPLLVRRSFLNLRRQPEVVVARIMHVVGLGIVVTVFVAPLETNYNSIQTRLGFIQQLCGTYFIGMLQNMAVYPSEKVIFHREHDDGVYGVEEFLMQYLTIEVPFEVATSLVFAVLVGLGAGIPRTVVVFFVCFFNCFCVVSCGESLGIMGIRLINKFNTLFDHTGFAVSIISVFLSISLSMSGILSINMPSILKAANYLSPIYYSIRSLAYYTLRDIHFTCDNDQQLPDGTCTINTGQDVLELYHLDTNPLVALLALGGCTLIYRGLVYVLLKARRTRWKSIFEEEEGR